METSSSLIQEDAVMQPWGAVPGERGQEISQYTKQNNKEEDTAKENRAGLEDRAGDLTEFQKWRKITAGRKATAEPGKIPLSRGKSGTCTLKGSSSSRVVRKGTTCTTSWEELQLCIRVIGCQLLSRVRLFRDPRDYSPRLLCLGISQARTLEQVIMSFSRDLLDSEIESMSPALAAGFFPSKPAGKHHTPQFSRSVMSESLRPHGLQLARPPCPSPTPRACLNSSPSSQWCHPTISSSVLPFSSCSQSFLASGSFPVSWFFTSGGQSIGVSASATVLPMNIQDWFPLGWTDWISLQSKGLSRVFSNTTVQKHQFFSTQPSLWSNSHIHTWPQENHSFH